jgi:chloride channel protein, CIC family
VAGLVAVLFIRSFFAAQEVAKRVPGPAVLQPILGGLAVGLLVWLSGGILVGYGHLAVRVEVFGGMALYALALLVLGKIAVTSLTLGFGGTGGVFTPSLYIGAATGGAFGVALTRLFPGLHLHPEAYALVGMGAMVAAATAAPITAILIVFEMTNDYAIVVPLMVAAVIAQLVARWLEPDSLYSGWLRRRGEHLVHGSDRDILAGLSVGEALDPNPTIIPESATVDQLLEHLGRSDLTEFPVVDGDRQLLGVISVAELGRLAHDAQAFTPVVIAADVASPSEVAAPGDSLLDATRKMGIRGRNSLPVVDPATGRLVGTITRAHVLAMYERAVAGAQARPL